MSEFVRCKNKDTGAIASLPLAALPMFFNWEQDDGPPPEAAKPKRNLSSLDESQPEDSPAVPAAATRRSNS